MSKLISTFKIGLDDETKAEIAALKSSLDAVSNGLKAGTFIPTGGLLAAMVCEAANDASESELLQIGQWVFEGQPKEFVTAHVNSFGAAAISSMPIGDIEPSTDTWTVKQDAQVTTPTCLYRELKGKFDTTNWQSSAISRQPVNDVDYLSETSEINVMEASDIIIDDMGRDYSHNSNCLHAVVPQITQADMQLIFIKNLSDVLIQRMHSMGRFSDDGRSVFCNGFKAWDIVVNKANDNPHYAVVCGFGVINSDEVAQKISLIKVTPWDSRDGYCQGGDWMIFGQKSSWRTVTEAELPAFRAALEACYA